jgi:hypothetical protein
VQCSFVSHPTHLDNLGVRACIRAVDTFGSFMDHGEAACIDAGCSKPEVVERNMVVCDKVQFRHKLAHWTYRYHNTMPLLVT